MFRPRNGATYIIACARVDSKVLSVRAKSVVEGARPATAGQKRKAAPRRRTPNASFYVVYDTRGVNYESRGISQKAGSV